MHYQLQPQNNPIETVSGQDFVKVYSYHMECMIQNLMFQYQVVGNKTGSVTNITNPSTVTTGDEPAGTYQSGATSSSLAGSGATFEITTTGTSGNEVFQVFK